MFRILNSAEEFDKQVTRLNYRLTKVKRYLISFTLILELIYLYFEISQTTPKQNNEIIYSKIVFFLSFYQITFLLIIFLISFLLSIQYVKTIETNKAVKQILELYGIEILDKNKGNIHISSNNILTIEWNIKGFFIIKKSDDVLSYAGSKELYWKVIYFSHVFNQYKIKGFYPDHKFKI